MSAGVRWRWANAMVAIAAVPVALIRAPEIIGYTRRGTPLYSIAGGAQPVAATFDNGSTTTNASSYQTANAKNYTAGRLYIMHITATMTSGTINDPTVFKLTTTGTAWTKIRASTSVQPRAHMYALRPGSNVTGDTVTVTYGTQSITGIDFEIVEITGYFDDGTLSHAYGSNHNDGSGSSAAPSVALTTAPVANSRVLGFGYQGANAAFTAGGSFTKLAETAGHASPNARGASERDTSAPVQTADWSITSANWIAMVLEVLSADAIASPSACAAVAACPAPTGIGTGVGTPAVAAGIGATPAPTAQGSGIAAPAVAAAIAAVPAPTAAGSAVAAPAVAAAIAACPAPTAIGTSPDATASPSTAAAAAAVPSPTAQGGGVGAPATAAAAGAVPSPTVIGSGVAAPAVAGAIAATPAVTAQGQGRPTPATAGAVAAVPAPTVRGTGVATPATATAIASCPAPTAFGGGGGVAGHPATAAAVAAVPSPTALGGGIATPATVAAITSTPAVSLVVSSAARPVTATAVAAVGGSGHGAAMVFPATVAAIADVPQAAGAGGARALPATVAAVAAALLPEAQGAGVASPEVLAALVKMRKTRAFPFIRDLVVDMGAGVRPMLVGATVARPAASALSRSSFGTARGRAPVHATQDTSVGAIREES